MKKYKDQIYTGMKVGGTHHWNYNDGKWEETKVTPDQWTIKFNSIKRRVNNAPINTGASIGTQFHWYIIADQIATKLDANSYMTDMEGMKFKIGHKRPHWKTFSYNYPEQLSYKKRVIEILKKLIKDLENSY
ncbi:MAG: hypothetical protein ACFFEO_03840 [Candidatus Thorarchaeota archaeon]